MEYNFRIKALRGLIYQGISVVCSLLTLPITISYLNTESYGLWIGIFSLYNVILNFDLGLGNGMRNLLSSEVSLTDDLYARKVINTNLIILVVLAILSFIFFNLFKNYAVPINIKNNLEPKFIVIFFVFAYLDIISRQIRTVYSALHFTNVPIILNATQNILFLFFLFVLNNTNTFFHSKLITVCFLYFSVPVFVNTMTINLSRKRYLKFLKFSVKDFSFILAKKILAISIYFFGIQIFLSLLTESTNIFLFENNMYNVLTSVNISDKYFGLISVVATFALFPVWSAVATEMSKGNYSWINHKLRKIEIYFIYSLAPIVCSLMIFPYCIILFFDSKIDIPFWLYLTVCLKHLAIILNSIYSYFLNGMGLNKLQLVLYITSYLFLYLFINQIYVSFRELGVMFIVPSLFLVMAYFQRRHLINHLSSFST
jgi:O-antigen/teichoic acid export membrane protein